MNLNEARRRLAGVAWIDPDRRHAGAVIIRAGRFSLIALRSDLAEPMLGRLEEQIVRRRLPAGTYATPAAVRRHRLPHPVFEV